MCYFAKFLHKKLEESLIICTFAKYTKPKQQKQNQNKIQ